MNAEYMQEGKGMGTAVMIVICFASVALAVLAVVIAVDRAGTRSLRQMESERRYEADMLSKRLAADGMREERAMAVYAIQSAMQTVQQSSLALERNTAAATAALASVAGAMSENDRLAIESLHTQAVVAEYTRLLAKEGREREFAYQLRKWNEARLTGRNGGAP